MCAICDVLCDVCGACASIVYVSSVRNLLRDAV